MDKTKDDRPFSRFAFGHFVRWMCRKKQQCVFPAILLLLVEASWKLDKWRVAVFSTNIFCIHSIHLRKLFVKTKLFNCFIPTSRQQLTRCLPRSSEDIKFSKLLLISHIRTPDELLPVVHRATQVSDTQLFQYLVKYRNYMICL